jgi:hypothetical protein
MKSVHQRDRGQMDGLDPCSECVVEHWEQKAGLERDPKRDPVWERKNLHLSKSVDPHPPSQTHENDLQPFENDLIVEKSNRKHLFPNQSSTNPQQAQLSFLGN